MGLRIRREAEIVGVVKNAKYNDLREKWRPIVYLPISQDQIPDTFPQVMILSALAPAGLTLSLKRIVDGIDPDINVDS